MDHFPEVLANILKGIEKTKDIVAEEDMFTELCKLIDPSK
jgi:hypothetical protein